MSFHVTVVSATGGEPPMEREDLLLYAGYNPDTEGKNITFKPYFYTVKTESGLKVRHIAMQSVIQSDCLVLVVTDLPEEKDLDPALGAKLSMVMAETFTRSGIVPIEIDGPFSPDPVFLEQHPDLNERQLAWRIKNGALEVVNDIARGNREVFQLIENTNNEG